jgi:hypothetical protein
VDADVSDLIAKQAITEVIYRYCRALDRMDRELIATVWHPDGTADYGSMFTGSASDWIAWVWVQHERFYRHSHQMTNVLIDVRGDRAVSETYAIVTLRARPHPGRCTTFISHNRYLDRWSQRDGRWAIDHRQLVSDFRTTLEGEEDEGSEGSPDSRRDRSDPSYVLFDGGSAR